MTNRILVVAVGMSIVMLSSPAAAETVRAANWCKTAQVNHRPGFRDGTADPIMYLNRCVGGCVISPGINDSGGNTSSMVSEDVTLSEFAHGDTVWNEVVDCVKEVMRPYDIEVVTEDPGSTVNHLESMVAGTSDEAGMENGVMGVSPVAWDCLPLNRTISFTFANLHAANDPREICETITHEAGHTLGLSHEMACDELMLYVTGRTCGPKFFRDEAYTCGEAVADDCICGGQQQNAHVKLLAGCGAGAGAHPPEVAVVSPADGETVDPEFRVYATAADDRGIRRVELVINGWIWSELEGHSWDNPNDTYTLRTPDNLPNGYLDVEVIAYNDLEVASTAAMTLLMGSPCTSPDGCAGGQLCEDGRCFWPPAAAVIGDECERIQDCIEGDCLAYDGEKRCSESCYPSVVGQCGEGLECVASGVTGICWPESGGGGGCCSVDGVTPLSYTNLGLFLAVLLMLSRRRRRRR